MEGCKLLSYEILGGKTHIGYGHTGDDVKPGMHITKEEANALFEKDYKNHDLGARELLTVSLTERQIDTLVSFVFNMGVENFKKSDLLKSLNNGEDPNTVVRRELPEWVYATIDDKGTKKILPGLKKRR